MCSRADVETKIKEVIIFTLNLEDYSVDDIKVDGPLFGDGLGLDSIDALELGLAIKDHFKVGLDVDENIKEHFYSVSTLADYIIAEKSNREVALEK